MSYFDDVGRFHEKLLLPRTNWSTPAVLLDKDKFLYRYNFLKEELEEFLICQLTNDLPGAADALADLVWVALGTAHYMGVPFDAVWDLVRAANMEKERAPDGDTDHKRGAVERIRKPEGWKPPDITRLLEVWNKRAHEHDARRDP